MCGVYSIIKLHTRKSIWKWISKKINELQSLLDKYKFKNEKEIIYRKLGNIFNDSRDFYKAYTYYLRAFENSNDMFNDPKLIDLIIYISYCCNNLKRYKETLNFNNLAYIYMDNIPEELEYKIKFNSVIAYKNLEDYDLGLKELDEIENSFKTKLNSEPLRKIKPTLSSLNLLNITMI